MKSKPFAMLWLAALIVPWSAAAEVVYSKMGAWTVWSLPSKSCRATVENDERAFSIFLNEVENSELIFLVSHSDWNSLVNGGVARNVWLKHYGTTYQKIDAPARSFGFQYGPINFWRFYENLDEYYDLEFYREDRKIYSLGSAGLKSVLSTLKECAARNAGLNTNDPFAN